MDYRELARLASNPPAVRLCAKTIKAVIGEELTDWERSFLDELEKFVDHDRLSTRQQEALHSLRSKATRRTMLQGFRASTLVKRLWEVRCDLSEESEEYISGLFKDLQEKGSELALSNGQWKFLFSVAREAGEIERYVEFS